MPDTKPPSVLNEWRRTSETKSVVFNNLCITGPDRASFWATFCVIVIPAVHFVVRTLPSLIMFEGAAWWALVVCFVWLVAMNLATLFKVALTDPGIVPRQQPPPGASDFSWPPAFKDVVIDGRPVQLKFCDTCYLYRPLRTIHCSVCNNCVTDFDHHCPWIGNCVGRRNYNDFFVFMTLSVLDIVVVVAGNIALLVLRGLDHNALSSASQSASSAADTEPVGIYLLRKFPDCFIVAIFLVCVIVPVLMLWGMHITLICRGITTNEKIKKISARHRDGKNPCLWCGEQYALALCRGTPPSAVDGRCGVLYTTTPEEREMQLRRRKQERAASEQEGLVGIVVVPPNP